MVQSLPEASSYRRFQEWLNPYQQLKPITSTRPTPSHLSDGLVSASTGSFLPFMPTPTHHFRTKGLQTSDSASLACRLIGSIPSLSHLNWDHQKFRICGLLLQLSYDHRVLTRTLAFILISLWISTRSLQIILPSFI